MTDPAMLSFVLRRARASVPIMGGFDKLQRRLQKAALAVFGSADSGPRVQAALLVRAMALLLPAPALDNVLKASHLRCLLRSIAEGWRCIISAISTGSLASIPSVHAQNE